MSGTYTIGEKKVRPGVYHMVENGGGVSVAGATNGIGAGIIKANWGPLNKVVELEPTDNAERVFGSDLTVDLISIMFQGGIASGKFVRLGTGGTATRITLKNTEDDDLVVITGKYVGTRAFQATIRDNVVGDARELIISEGTAIFAEIEFAASATDEGANLVAAINDAGIDFTAALASATASGKLKDVTQSAFTAGTNPTVAVGDYTSALELFDGVRLNCLCVDTEDAAVHALVNAYLNRSYLLGRYPMACVAEAGSVDLDTRISHAAAYNNYMMHFVLNACEDATGKVYAGYKAAALVGGMIAAVAANRSLTHAVISGMTAVYEPLSDVNIRKALTKGCLVFTENADSQVWIEQGINTLITPDADHDEGWKKIRRVKTRFELMQRIDDTLDSLVGQVNNDTDGRAALVAAGQHVCDTMAGEKKLMSDSSFTEDPNQVSQGDSAYFLIAVDDIDSIEKVYLRYRFRFAAE